MTGGFLPRFVLEVAFLSLLALAAGLAELATAWIIGVMAVGWVLVALVEWLAWKSETAQPPGAHGGQVESAVEPADSWDMEEILAPVPEPESGTKVLPPEDSARSAGTGS